MGNTAKARHRRIRRQWRRARMTSRSAPAPSDLYHLDVIWDGATRKARFAVDGETVHVARIPNEGGVVRIKPSEIRAAIAKRRHREALRRLG